jgi:PAS domain S-box-containing protein
MRRVPKIFELNALSITLFYLIFALLWILLSDQFLIWITDDPLLISRYQTFKGIFYVAITTLFLYWLIQKSNAKIAKEKNRIDDSLIAAGKATWSMDLESKNIRRSRFHHKIYGLEKRPRTWDLDSFKNLVHPDDIKQLTESIENAVAHKTPSFNHQYRIITPKGETRWIESRGNLIFDKNQNPIEIGGVITDITEQKQLMREYQREKELFESIFEHIPVMIDITSENLEGIRINKAYKEYTGFTESDIKNPEVFNQVYRDPEMRKKALEAIEQADGTWYEFENYNKKGEKRIQQWANIKLSDGSTIGIGLDVTEQKKMEKKHERDRLELQTVYENIPVFINLHDNKQHVYRFNSFFRERAGYTNEDLQDSNLIRAMIPEDEQQDAFEHMKTADGSWKDFTIITKSGEKLNTTWANVKVNEDLKIGIGIDTTELKESQMEIAESRKLLKKTFESLKEAVFILEPETRIITHCNESASELFGYTKEELIGGTTHKLHVSKDKYYEFDEIGKERLEKHGYFQTEFVLQKKDGSQFYSDHTVTLIKGENGGIEKVVSVIQDITNQKKYEKELKQHSEFIENTLQNLPIGVAVNQIDSGDITLINKKFTEIYGWPEETVSDIPTFFEKVYPDKEYREQVSNMVLADINSGDPARMNWEGISITTKKGEKKIINAKNIPLYDQNLMISTVVDVTQQFEAEQKLAESEHKYRLLFQKSPMPMWIFNPETLEFVEVNNAAVEHYGYSRDEFRNMTLYDIRPETEHQKLKQDILAPDTSTKERSEWRHIKKNGEVITVQITTTNIDYFGNNFRLILVNDITEQKKAEERVLASLVKGENEERARIARELHDGLGQYLAAANMNLDAIQSTIEELDERTQNQFDKGLNLLKHAVNETAQISRNLLPRVVDDYGLALAIEALIDNYTSNSEVQINYYQNIGDLELSNEIEFNLYRVAQEGLSNAMKYAQASKINVQLIKDELDLILSIDDNGIGFDPSSSDFTSGLGLQTIKTRAGALGGEVEIDSKPGKGTMLSVIVPIK